MSATLTIAIPTYNRPVELSRLVSTILDQVEALEEPEAIHLLIIDNHSAQPVAASLPPRALGSPIVEVVTNRVNIGGSANLLRCFELCRSEWLWIIGDDDRLAAGGLRRAVEAVASYPDVAAINFTISRYPRQKTACVTCLGEFLERIDHFDTVVFAANTLYRVECFSPYLKYGYLYASTWAPHIATLLKVLEKGAAMMLVAAEVVENPGQRPVEQQWPAIAYCLGLGLLLDGMENRTDRRRLATLLGRGNDFLFKAAFHLALMGTRNVPRSYTTYCALQMWSRWWRHSASLRFRVAALLMMGGLLVSPALLARILITGAQHRRGKTFTLRDLPDFEARL